MKLVNKKLSEVFLDEDQPRKEVKDEDINILVESIKQFGLINPIEINEDGYIITGELRYRALEKSGIEEHEFELIEGLSDVEIMERQYAENEHRTRLSDVDRENFIKELWDTNEYKSKTELGKKLGLSRPYISEILEAKKIREIQISKFQNSSESDDFSKIPTTKLVRLRVLPSNKQTEVIKEIINNELTDKQVKDKVRDIKEAEEQRAEISKRRLDDQKAERYRTLERLIESRIGYIEQYKKSIINNKNKLIIMAKDIYENIDFIEFSDDIPEAITTEISLWLDSDDEYKKYKQQLNALKNEFQEKVKALELEYKKKTKPIKDHLDNIDTNSKFAERCMGNLLTLFNKIEEDQESLIVRQNEIEQFRNELGGL